MNHKQRLFQIKALKLHVTTAHYPITAPLQPPVEAVNNLTIYKDVVYHPYGLKSLHYFKSLTNLLPVSHLNSHLHITHDT